MHSHGFALVVRSSFPSSEAASEHMFCIRRVMNHVLLWCDDCSHASASSLLIMTAAFFSDVSLYSAVSCRYAHIYSLREATPLVRYISVFFWAVESMIILVEHDLY